MRVDPAGATVTKFGDPRVTKLGQFLRSSKLDELPQLFHVVSGKMSLVGRRPEDPNHTIAYTESERRVFLVPPGLTGPAVAVNEEKLLKDVPVDEIEVHYLTHLVPAKISANLEYFDSWRLRSDLKILWSTVKNLIDALQTK